MSEYTDQICGIGLPNTDGITEEKKVLGITIAVFFDGTRNNKYNIERANSPVVQPYIDLESDNRSNACDDNNFALKNASTYVAKRHNAKVPPKVPKKNNDSYLDTFSNVAELFESYAENKSKNIGKVYVEGIGTAEPIKDENDRFVSSGEEDSQSGFAFGKGVQGINGKIERGCKLIVDELNKLKTKDNKATIATLTLDVFGFSRGAAAARSFVHRIEKIMGKEITDASDKKMVSEGKEVSLRKYLTDRHIKIGKIEVRFLGVFDTVPSFAPGNFTDLNFSNDTQELGLTVPETVGKTVHLVAADEYRKNFALTTIKEAGKKVVELILHGARSDIGGGYRIVQKEKIVMVPAYYSYIKEVCRGYMTFDELKTGWWLPPTCESKEMDKSGKCSVARTMTERTVYNSYAKIPLELMGEFAKKHSSEIKFDNEVYSSVIKIESNHSQHLSSIRALIIGMLSSEKNQLYQFSTETFGLFNKKRTIVQPICDDTQMNMIKRARESYIHLSAWNDKAGYGLVEPYEPADDRKRLIYQG